MWLVDATYLQQMRDSVSDAFITVDVPESAPHVDLDVFSNAELDASALDGSDPVAGLERRYRQLRRRLNELAQSHLLVVAGNLIGPPAGRPDAGNDDVRARVFDELWTTFLRQRVTEHGVLLVPGPHDVASASGLASSSEDGTARAQCEYAGLVRALARNAAPDAAISASLPVATVLRVRSGGANRAYVAIVGFHSTGPGRPLDGAVALPAIDSDQLDAASELVSCLAGGPAASVPLYVVGVSHHRPVTVPDAAGLSDVSGPDRPAAAKIASMSNAEEVLRRCAGMRMSLLVHAATPARDVVSIASAPIRAGRSPMSLPLVPAPSWRGGTLASGLCRLRLQVDRGEAQLAFSYETPGGEDSRPVQVVRPLISASRVSAGEQRLRAEAAAIMAAGPGDTSEFRREADAMWHDHGLVALCRPSGRLPELPVSRHTDYKLLLLLRERRGGGYDMLLSNHTPLKISEFAEWNSLLVPAFQSVRSLLQRLRDDVVRQARDQAEDLEKAAQARAFEASIDSILAAAGPATDVWSTEIREVDSETITKISPTSAGVTTYNYRMITLLPLVTRPATLAADVEDSAPERSLNRVLDWLERLPAVRRTGERDVGVPALPMHLISGDGSGLRYAPPNADTVASQTTDLPPGAVWFPVREADDTRSPWEDCPSIVARNADVMRWVDRVLDRLRQTDGRFPSSVVLGAAPPAEHYEVVERYPFRTTEPEPADEALPPRSTEQGLRRMRLTSAYDLRDIRPYREAVLERVYLAKRQVRLGKRDRWVIQVLRAEVDRPQDTAVRLDADGKLPDVVRPEAVIGILRPVQRYVLASGLERAKEVVSDVLETLDDPWGYARVRKGPAPRLVSVTPPVIEQLGEEDQEDDRFGTEFVLCDGNHRVVHAVWNQGRPLPAIAVHGEPRQPYYARPFSAFEWELTAQNEKDTPPDTESKYLARAVTLAGLSASAREELSARPSKDWYRRYFRDFNSGFIDVGGQGGKF